MRGKAFKFGDNISTDHIAPGRLFHLRSNLEEFSKHVLEDADETFAQRMKKGDFVVAGSNFGLGSSREHAPQIIKIAGVGAVIAKSFARIFYRNAINIGLLAIECDTDAIDAGDELDVDIEKGFMKGGNKNESSKDRIVPIHSKVISIVQNFYDISKRTGSEYLISIKGGRVLYRYYLDKFHAMCKNYGLNEKHRPHDCRVRFVTEGKYNNMDEYALKRIVGHSIPDITERVYSKRGLDWLKAEIEKIK